MVLVLRFPGGFLGAGGGCGCGCGACICGVCGTLVGIWYAMDATMSIVEA